MPQSLHACGFAMVNDISLMNTQTYYHVNVSARILLVTVNSYYTIDFNKGGIREK